MKFLCPRSLECLLGTYLPDTELRSGGKRKESMSVVPACLPAYLPNIIITFLPSRAGVCRHQSSVQTVCARINDDNEASLDLASKSGG